MSDLVAPCDHDKRFGGVFFLPKEDHGCLACGYERLTALLAAERLKRQQAEHERDCLVEELAEARKEVKSAKDRI